MYKRKPRILTTIRRSALTGKAVWLSHDRTRDTERKAYRRACLKEFTRMRQWANTMARRRKNVLSLLNEATDRLPILGDISKEQRAAAKTLTQLANKEPPKQSDFYDHIREERRQRENARKREKRWQEKYGNKNNSNNDYDK